MRPECYFRYNQKHPIGFLLSPRMIERTTEFEYDPSDYARTKLEQLADDDERCEQLLRYLFDEGVGDFLLRGGGPRTLHWRVRGRRKKKVATVQRADSRVFRVIFHINHHFHTLFHFNLGL